jgi:hypothetical protein
MLRSNVLLTSASVLALMSSIACSSGSEPPPEYPPVGEPEPVTTTTVTREPLPEPPPPPPVQIVAAERTPLEGSPPSLRIRAPRANQLVRRGNVMLNVQLTGWDLAPEPGKHVHVIVDNEPYIAVRDVSEPIDLNALVQTNLGHELAAGTHVVRVFPSHNHHESVKDGTPFAMVVFHYQSRTEGFALDPRAPLLTYSRPKGCNVAGERVLLDFYLANVDALAADGTRVHYAIDGEVSGDIVQWAPHYIENLPVGEHTVELVLVGADGAAIAGPFNDTTRTITVAETCAAAQAPAPAAPAPAAPTPAQ